MIQIRMVCVLSPICHHSDAYSSPLGRINLGNGWDGPGLMANAWIPEGGQLVVTISGAIRACQAKLGWDDTHTYTGLNNGAYPGTAMPRGQKTIQI